MLGWREDTLKWRVLDIISWHGGGVEAHSTGKLARQLVLKVLSAFIFFATMDENFVLEFFRNDLVLKCYILSALRQFDWAYFSGKSHDLFVLRSIQWPDSHFLWIYQTHNAPIPFTHNCETFKMLSVKINTEHFSHFFQIKTGNFCRWNVANTNPEEWRIALSIVAHCEIVWLWPQDLHNVLIELCLFFLYGESRYDGIESQLLAHDRVILNHTSGGERLKCTARA